MDVLDVLDRLDEIKVLFEPIYSADSHVIVAYEVLGELQVGEQTIDIRKFTYDQSVPEDIRKEAEETLVEKAIQIAKNSLFEVGLFLPCNPNLFVMDFGESYFQKVKALVDEEWLSKIYLVMSAHKYKGEAEELHHPIRYMQTYGIKIALNEVGSESKLDQILMLEPAVLKMNVSQLNYNAWGSNSHVFTTIQSLAVKIGATLMFDDIKTDYQLHHAWKHGARYFKGEYLQKPQEFLIPRDTLKEKFRDECKQFIAAERKQLEQKYQEMNKLQKVISTIVDTMKPKSDDVSSLLQMAEKLEQYAFRFYICNDEGFQTSPNIVRKGEKWEVEKEAIGKNWSWRPYFLFNMIQLKNNNKGQLSATYSDIKTGELTRTFSTLLDDDEYLFVDITYDYLYEHNIVN